MHFSSLFRMLGATLLLSASLTGIACEPANIALPDPGPNAVEITVTTTPPGSMVSVDGIPIGNSPAKVRLRPGRHTVKAMKSGYFSAEQRITAASDTPPALTLTLVASH